MSDVQMVNGAHLRQVEASSRTYVRQHPDDMKARLELAWCLLVQALYEAGREAPTSARQPYDTEAYMSRFTEAEVECEVFAAAQRDHSAVDIRSIARADNAPYRSDGLFRECLHQAITVQQLSPHPEDHLSAKHLQQLVCLSGGESVVAASQKSLLDRALSMFRDITQQVEDPA